MRPFRNEKVGSLIRDIIGEALLHRMQDPRIAMLTSISRVEVSTDLQIAKIFLTVPGGEVEERKTMAAIQHGTAFLQRLVASELSLRTCPELRFELDLGAKVALETLNLIEQNRREMDAAAESDSADDETDDDTENGIVFIRITMPKVKP